MAAMNMVLVPSFKLYAKKQRRPVWMVFVLYDYMILEKTSFWFLVALLKLITA